MDGRSKAPKALIINTYIHPTKPGKVTIPYHSGDIAAIIIKAILKQAEL
jgi:predicted RNA binding protein YcfA (HicA-like mRNA interferase family)